MYNPSVGWTKQTWKHYMHMAKNNKLPFQISHSSCVNGSMCPCQSLLGHSNDLDLVVMSVGSAVASERLIWAFSIILWPSKGNRTAIVEHLEDWYFTLSFFSQMRYSCSPKGPKKHNTSESNLHIILWCLPPELQIPCIAIYVKINIQSTGSFH